MTEAIDALATPSVREEILALALQAGRLAAIPERGTRFGAFVRGPLVGAIAQVLGRQAAQSVLAELAPLVARVHDEGHEEEVSRVRPSSPALERVSRLGARPERRPRTDPAPNGDQHLFLVASSDPRSVSALSKALSGVACVEPVSDAVAVLEGLGRHGPSVVILDCRHPTVQAQTLLALDPELPPGSRVVLWGEPPSLEAQLALLGTGIPTTWVFCGHDATADDVAAVCRVLLA